MPLFDVSFSYYEELIFWNFQRLISVNINDNVVSHENKGSQGVDRGNIISDAERFKEEKSTVL